MKKKKGFKRMMAGILAMAATAAVVFTGCGGDSDVNSEGGKKDGNDVVITFAGWGSLAEKQNFTKMIDKFEETHPGVKVNYQKFQGIEVPQSDGKKDLKQDLLFKVKM